MSELIEFYENQGADAFYERFLGVRARAFGGGDAMARNSLRVGLLVPVAAHIFLLLFTLALIVKVDGNFWGSWW